MKRKRFAVLVTVIIMLLVLTSCSSKTRSYKLEYNYQKGDKFEYIMDMEGTMEFAEGEEQHSGSTQYNMVITQEVIDLDEDGRYKIKSIMDQVKMTNEIDGEKIQVPNMFGSLEFIVTMDKHGKTYSIEGLNMDMLGMGMQTTMDLNRMLENSNPMLPDYPVRVGDTWENSIEVPVPGTRDVIKATSKIKFEGVEEMNGQKVAKISTNAEIPIDITYDLRKMMESMAQSLPNSQVGAIPGMTMEITGHEQVNSISYMTLDKGLPLLTEGKIDMDMDMTTFTEGKEENSVSMKMNSSLKVELK